MPKEQNRWLIYIVGTNHYIKEYIILNHSRAIIPDEECLSRVLDHGDLPRNYGTCSCILFLLTMIYKVHAVQNGMLMNGINLMKGNSREL
jgi:hypothetical protein